MPRSARCGTKAGPGLKPEIPTSFLAGLACALLLVAVAFVVAVVIGIGACTGETDTERGVQGGPVDHGRHGIHKRALAHRFREPEFDERFQNGDKVRLPSAAGA